MIGTTSVASVALGLVVVIYVLADSRAVSWNADWRINCGDKGEGHTILSKT